MRYLLILLFLKSFLFGVCVNPYLNNGYYVIPYTSGYYYPSNLGADPLPDGSWSCIGNDAIKITQHLAGRELYDQYKVVIASNCQSPNKIYTREGLQYCEIEKECTAPKVLNIETNTCDDPPPDEGDGDHDNDGTPNKADTDYPNFSEMDMDGDGTPNGDDSDMDGDGTPNDVDGNPLDSSNSESCPVNNYMLNNVTSENCHIGSIDFLPTDGDVAYITYAQYDTCRNKCAYEYSYCPTDTVINNGECKPVEPPKGSCSGTTQCKTIGLGVNGIECIKNCYCITADNTTMTSENLYFSQTVSCDDTKTDKEKYEDLKNDNPTDTNTPDNPLADSNGSVDYNNAESVKAALQSYGASTELTSQKQLRELEIQSLQAVATNTKLDGLKSVVENFSAVSTSNQGVINGTLQGIKDGQNISNTLLGGINDGVGTTNELLTDIKGLLGDGNGTSDGSSDSNGTSDISLDFISSEMNNILTKYTISLTPSCGVISSVPVSVFGKSLSLLSQDTLNILPVSELRLFIIFMFTILAISLSFRTT